MKVKLVKKYFANGYSLMHKIFDAEQHFFDAGKNPATKPIALATH
jgi:hypothetical protein